jgi:hypothetical protein
MTEKPTKKDALAPRKRWPKHGLYSWIDSKRVPEGRAFQAVRRELGHLRTELIEAHGGEKITPDQRILIDSVVEALGIQKLSSLYLRRYGVIDGVAAGAGRLELNPILGKNWLAFGNTVRQGVLALAELERARKQEDPGPTPIEILAEAVRDEESQQPAPGDPGVDGQDVPAAADEGREGDSE